MHEHICWQHCKLNKCKLASPLLFTPVLHIIAIFSTSSHNFFKRPYYKAEEEALCIYLSLRSRSNEDAYSFEIWYRVTRESWPDGCNTGLEQVLWATADCQVFIPKDDSETCHCNFDPPWGYGSPALVPPEI